MSTEEEFEQIMRRTSVAAHLMKRFGPIGRQHFDEKTGAEVFDAFMEVAAEVITIVNEGRIK